MRKRYLSLLMAVAMACYSGLPAYAEASELFSGQDVIPEVVDILDDTLADTPIDTSADAIALDEDESNVPEPEAPPEPEFTPEVPEKAEISTEPEATSEPENSSEIEVLPDASNTASEPESTIDF